MSTPEPDNKAAEKESEEEKPELHKKAREKKSLKTRLRDYLAKPPSTGATIVIGVAVIFIAGGVAAIISYFVKPFSIAAGEVPFYAYVAGGSGIILGLLFGWLFTRQYYHLSMANRELQFNALQQKVTHLGQARENLRRLDSYSDYIYGLHEAFVMRELSLHDVSSEDAERALCEVSAECLSDMAKANFVVSVWAEVADDSDNLFARATDRATGFVRDRISGSVASALEPSKFEILAGHLTDKKAFAVRAASSWLKHQQLQEDDEQSEDEGENEDLANDSALEVSEVSNEGHPRSMHSENIAKFVYNADAPYDKLSGGDIKAFRSHNYHSVRAISFLRPGRICYLIRILHEAV